MNNISSPDRTEDYLSRRPAVVALKETLGFWGTWSNRGQSLIEVLVSIGVFTVGVVAVGLLVFDAEISTRQGTERTQAVLLAKEGLEAARSIRDADFDSLTAGNHGIELSGNNWIFSGTADTQDQFTRQVAITDIDIDTKKIQSTVNWQLIQARPISVTMTDYLTDWSQTQGQAGQSFVVDTSAAKVSSSEIQDMTIQNNGGSSVTIDKISVSWGSADYLISNVYIGTTRVWGGGTGSPSGNQPSGTLLDIANFQLDAGINRALRFVFNNEIDNDRFIVKFIMTVDGSTKYVLADFQDGQASALEIDLSQAVVVNQDLRGVRLRNVGTQNLVLDRITATWTNLSRNIRTIRIGGIDVWSGNSISGSELDINNYTLLPSMNWTTIDRFRFSGGVSGNTFNITFTLGNNSGASTGSFTR